MLLNSLRYSLKEPLLVSGSSKLHRNALLVGMRWSSTETSQSPILYSEDGPKATITLNNAKLGNALDVNLQHSLIQHLKSVSERPNIRAIILTGVGKYFCTGMNLSGEGESLSGNNEEQHDRLKVLFELISSFRKPVIAVINGPCYGGGNGLAMVADFRIASHPGVTFNLSEVKLGVSPALISKYLVREWGPAKTREAMLLAKPLTSNELLPLGGIQHIAENQEDALAYADKLVTRIVRNAPGAINDCKRLICTMANESEEKQDNLIREIFTEMMRPSIEAQYGIKTFREKITPDWLNIPK